MFLAYFKDNLSSFGLFARSWLKEWESDPKEFFFFLHTLSVRKDRDAFLFPLFYTTLVKIYWTESDDVQFTRVV